MEPLETRTYDNGVTARIFQDDTDASPAEWDNLGTVYVANRRDQVRGWELCGEDRDISVYIRAHRIAGNAVIPLSIADAGSSGWYFHATDDDRADGYIVALPANVEIVGTPKERQEDVLRGEIEDWRMCLNGEVYGCEFVTADGAPLEGGWWGSYGYEATIEEADAEAAGFTPEEITEANAEYLTTRRDEAQATADDYQRRLDALTVKEG